MLILTEKPSVAKDFSKALDCTYQNGYYYNKHTYTTIINCIGHLFSLEEPKHYNFDNGTLPIIPNKFEYCINSNTEKQTKLVISILKKHINDTILIATDADREGEVIARECLLMAGINNFSKIKRFWVSQALTSQVIKNGIQGSQFLSNYNHLSNQGFARQHSDWLVGMNFSRYVCNNIETKGLSIGRIQTCLLNVISERCKAIKNFKSSKYFEFYGVFSDSNNNTCKGIYFENDKTSFFNDSLEAKLNTLLGQKVSLKDTKKELKESSPPQLYNLNALQKDSYKYYGYTAEETLKITQSLYEDLKCVSYPRTPSRVMGSNNVELCKTIFDDLYNSNEKLKSNKELKENSNISLSNKRVFNDAKLEAHHALIPLKNIVDSASISQKNIYGLIYNRFMIAFLPPEKYEKTTYILDIKGSTFKVIGKKIINIGWKEFDFNVSDNKDNVKDNIEEQVLDNIDWNNLSLNSIDKEEKWTRSPPYFNEASILSFMENPKDINVENNTDSDKEIDAKKLIGLGTPATRHTFIPILIKRGYIKVEKKNFISTPLGEELLKVIKQSSIKDLSNVDETTKWEEELNKDPISFENDIKEFIRQSVNKKINMEGINMAVFNKENSSKDTLLCPLCHRPIFENAKAFSCSGWKEEENKCNFTIWKSICNATLTRNDIKLLLSNKLSSVKKMKSKAGKEFMARVKLNDEHKTELVFENKKN